MKNIKPDHKQPIVCLDAGHYGKYNHSPAVPEYYESDMVWKLHNYLAAELQAYGIQVKKTRANQATDLSLYKRGAASAGCDLFLSLHSNAAGSTVNETVDYVVVYHLYEDAGTDADDKSKELAGILAPLIAKTMGTKQGGKIKSRLGSGDHNGDGVLNDNYYSVLNGARQVGTPGLILEHSFHTNTRATKWLLDDKNLQQLAKLEAASIAAWFGVDKPAEEPEQLYRIRKTWADAKSQTGAYKSLDGAKKACPVGYSVFDWNGKAVYTNEPKPTTYTMTLPVLKRGDKGDQVKAVQQLLLANKISLAQYGADGSFGGVTEAGVIAFQKAVGIPASGQVDQKTMSKLLGA